MIRLLISMVVAGAVAAAIEGNGTAKTLGFLAALLVLIAGPAFWRWLVAPSADAYGPRIQDDQVFTNYLAKIRKVDRNRAARFRSLRKLREKVAGAFAVSNEHTSEGRIEAASELLDSILAEHSMAPWTRWRLRRRFAHDRAAFDRAKYAHWALDHLERAGKGSESVRRTAREAAAQVIARGLADPRADHGPLRALGREHGLLAPEPRAAEPDEELSVAVIAPPPSAAPKTSTATAPVQEPPIPPAATEPAAVSRVAADRWAPPYDSIEVGGVTLRDGMVWIGTRFSEEPSAIDPELAVSEPRSDRRSDPEGASYREWTPTQRGAYLRWLSEGRRDADAPQAFARLFLDGLERRLVVDADAGRVTRTEVGVLVHELLELAERQARRSTIAGAARSLGDWAILRFAVELDVASEAHMTLALALARAYSTGRSPTAGLAWSWAHAQTRSKRVALRRAPKEVRALFELRYALEPLRHDALRATGELSSARHAVLNRSLAGRIVEIADPLPAVDVEALPASLSKLLDGACEALEAYARALGDPPRTPDLAALALLPNGVLEASEAHALTGLRSQLSVALATRETAFFEARELFGEFRGTKKASVAFARVCDALGHGFEPDVRFGAAALKPSTRIAVFWASGDSPREPTPEVSLARGVLELAVGVCAADGVVDAVERAQLIELIDDELGLGEHDRPRMQAFFERLVDKPPRKPALSKLGIPDEQRASIARMMVRIATARGPADPSAVRVLERIYAALGLEARSLHTDLHTGGEAPAPRAPEGPKVIDRERLRAKRAETNAVAALLKEVFDGDEGPPVSVAATTAGDPGEPVVELEGSGGDSETAADPELASDSAADLAAPAAVDDSGAARCVAGLDEAHSALALALALESEMARADVEALAGRLGLLADGALDVLNDRAFELYDAPFWEGDDPIEIDPETAREMTT